MSLIFRSAIFHDFSLTGTLYACDCYVSHQGIPSSRPWNGRAQKLRHCQADLPWSRDQCSESLGYATVTREKSANTLPSK